MTDEKKDPRKTRPSRMPTLRTALAKSDPEAKRKAAVVLEVLGGMRSPSSAAEALSMSLPRYYALEARAVAGLVAACGAKPRHGRQQSPEAEAAALTKEVERLTRQCDRWQALVRASHRVVGVAAPPSRPPQKGKKRRRPIPRAAKAVEVLHSASPAEAAPTASNPPSGE